MPIIGSEMLQRNYYRLNISMGGGLVDNVLISSDGLYSVYYIRNGRYFNETGRIPEVNVDYKNPQHSYILLDYSHDRSSQRERIYFYQVQLIKDITPNNAYKIAVEHGFEGTEEEWLASLKGEKGDPGENAYEIAVDHGYQGTLENWMAEFGDTTAIKQDVDALKVTSQVHTAAIDRLDGKVNNLTTEVASVNHKVNDLEDFLEKNPTVDNPKIKITVMNGKEYEVGTSIQPAYSTEFNQGKYEFGPEDTGVSMTSISVIDTNGNHSTDPSGIMPLMVVGDDTAYTITAESEYSDGVIPKTNLGNDRPEYAIQAGISIDSATHAITGARFIFAGTRETKEGEINSSLIRSLDGFSSTNLNSFTFDIPLGTMQIIIATPTDNIESIVDNSTQHNIISAFKKMNVMVEGKDGYTAKEYTVYVLNYAEPNIVETSYIVELQGG